MLKESLVTPVPKPVVSVIFIILLCFHLIPEVSFDVLPIRGFARFLVCAAHSTAAEIKKILMSSVSFVFIGMRYIIL